LTHWKKEYISNAGEKLYIEEAIRIAERKNNEFAYKKITECKQVIFYEQSMFCDIVINFLLSVLYICFYFNGVTSFNLIKIFKNNAGENVLKIFGGLEADLFSNDDFEDKAKNHFKISSLKGVLYDHFKFGYDSEFVTGAKTMVIFGGMFKINEVLSLDFDIFKNLPFIDLNISNDWKSSSDKFIAVANDAKNCVGKPVKEWKQSFFCLNIPGLGIKGNFNCGDLGKCSLGAMVLPIILTEKLAKNDSIYSDLGFGVKFNTDFQFLKGIDSFKVGAIFGRGIGDYVTKVKKSAKLIKRSHNDLAGVPASIFLINEGKTVKSLELANFLDLSLFYAFKINPVHKVVCNVANLHFLNDYTEGKFLDKSGKNHYVNNILTLGLGYVFSVCKKMDFFANLNGVVFIVKNKDEKTSDLKDVDKKWGWGIDFGAYFKI